MTIGKILDTLVAKSIDPANILFVIIPFPILAAMLEADIVPPNAVSLPAILIELFTNFSLEILPFNIAFVIILLPILEAIESTVMLPPNETFWLPIVIALFANLLFSILPANCALVMPDIILLGAIVSSPNVVIIWFVVTEPPNAVSIPPIVIELFTNLLLAMLPANWEFNIPPANLSWVIPPANIELDTVCESAFVISVPVISGNVNTRSAVGLETANVVSKSSLLDPSNTIFPVKLREDVVIPSFTANEPCTFVLRFDSPIFANAGIVLMYCWFAVLIEPHNSSTLSTPGVIVKSPTALASAVVVPNTNASSDSSQPINTLSLVPLSIIKPASLLGNPTTPFDKPIKLSLISRLLAFTVVVVPLTVRSPVITALAPTYKSLLTQALEPR